MKETFGIGEAVERLRAGKLVSRKEWAKGDYAYLVRPTSTGRAWLIIDCDGDDRHWHPLGEDLLADDWYEVT